MFNWKSDEGKQLLRIAEQAKQKGHTYSEIAKMLKKKLDFEVHPEALRFAMKRKEKEEQNTLYKKKIVMSESKEEEFEEESWQEEYEEKIQAEKEKAIKQKEKRLLNTLLKERAKTEIMIETVRECISAFPAPKAVKEKPVRKDREKEEALLLFSDAQLGEEIKLEDTNGFGEYNVDIFKSRMDYLSDEIRRIAEVQQTNIERLNIFMLGDNVDGLGIYRGQDHHLDVLVVDQVLIGAEQIAKNLIECLSTFERIRIWGIVGNHGRVGKKGEYPTTVNWDYVLYKMLEKMLENYSDRIEWIIPKSNWCIADVCGQNFLLIHGDTIKGWNGLPYYGIDRADSRLKTMLASKGQNFRYMCLGHHHNPADIDSPAGEKILNGTMVGGSDFSINILHTSSRPSQWYFGVKPKKGITWRYKILLDEEC
jgi:hypothetical protein